MTYLLAFVAFVSCIGWWYHAAQHDYWRLRCMDQQQVLDKLTARPLAQRRTDRPLRLPDFAYRAPQDVPIPPRAAPVPPLPPLDIQIPWQPPPAFMPDQLDPTAC